MQKKLIGSIAGRRQKKECLSSRKLWLLETDSGKRRFDWSSQRVFHEGRYLELPRGHPFAIEYLSRIGLDQVERTTRSTRKKQVRCDYSLQICGNSAAELTSETSDAGWYPARGVCGDRFLHDAGASLAPLSE